MTENNGRTESLQDGEVPTVGSCPLPHLSAPSDLLKVAVIGSRSFTDYERLCADLDRAHKVWGDFVVVNGGARGADFLAARWARERGLPEPILFLPDYPAYGRGAPLKRNHLIVEACDRLIAFWDGESRGTAYTIRLAEEAGKRVIIRRSK